MLLGRVSKPNGIELQSSQILAATKLVSVVYLRMPKSDMIAGELDLRGMINNAVTRVFDATTAMRPKLDQLIQEHKLGNGEDQNVDSMIHHAVITAQRPMQRTYSWHGE